MQILIKNAIIASNGVKYNKKHDILIKNGVIKKIEQEILEESIEKLDKVIDANFKVVMPGFIDLECKTSQTGYENKDNMKNLTRAAVQGGYTTLVTSPKNMPIVDNKTVVEYVYSKSKNKNYINLYPIAGCTKNNGGTQIAEIGEMYLAGAVAISDADCSITDTILLRDIFVYSKMLDITFITSGLESKLGKSGMVHYGYISTKLGLKGIPYEAEVMEVSRKVILANYTGAKIHIPYITTAGAIEVIRKAKEDGTNITCSTSPHYFTLTEENIENYNTLAKVMPPLKEQQDIESVREAIRDGTIDFITSGHSPVLFENKHVEFERAEFGISSIDTVFSLTYTKLIKEFGNNLDYGIEAISLLLSKRVAEMLKFKTKGEIAEGFDADIVIVDESIEYVIDSSKFKSRAKFSPYDGEKVYGKVLLTMVSGNVLFDINNNMIIN